MDNVKNDRYYLEKLLNDVAFILSHSRGLTSEQLKKDEVLADCIMFRMIQISENAGKLSEEFRIAHPQIPWRAVKGMRNRIVRDYGDVDLSVVFDTVKYDIPELFEMLQFIIR